MNTQFTGQNLQAGQVYYPAFDLMPPVDDLLAFQPNQTQHATPNFLPPQPQNAPEFMSFPDFDDFLPPSLDDIFMPEPETAQPATKNNVLEIDEQTFESEDIPSKKNSKVYEAIMDIALYGVALAILFGAIAFNFSNSQDKSLFGYRFYNVLTPSMEPVFSPGDMIFVKLCSLDEVEIEDIVTFVPGNNPNNYLTHRLMEIKEPETPGQGQQRRFITQGDTNNDPDPSIAEEQLIGKYIFRIPKMGIVINLVRHNLIVMSICIVALLLFVILLRSLTSGGKGSKPGPEKQKPKRSKLRPAVA